MIIEDIVALSAIELEKIEIKINFSKISLSQRELIEIIDFFKLLENKCHLIKEQNILIKTLYCHLWSFKEEIKKKEKKIAKKNNLKNIPYIEYIFLEYIIKYLKEVQKSADFDFKLTISQIEKIEIQQNEYRAEKKNIVDILEKRSKFCPEKNFDISSNIDNIKTFNIDRNSNNKSFFNFFS